MKSYFRIRLFYILDGGFPFFIFSSCLELGPIPSSETE